ncbi:MAG: ribose 5-phosphate isomerase B [Candidatus Aminicenantes bacterium]|nr:ribose 5-phosphate isomerase B [Candidatus Aminicenantes bacterium]
MNALKKMDLVLAADHAGFELKEKIKESLLLQGFTVDDCGVNSVAAANWAEFGAAAAAKVSADPQHKMGILVCGSGIGMSIVANKFRNVRAALCHDENAALLARSHNDANVLALGARVVDSATALKIVAVFLQTAFAGGRHQVRLDYLRDGVENKIH